MSIDELGDANWERMVLKRVLESKSKAFILEDVLINLEAQNAIYTT
jgi:hypothetical protein